MMARSDLPVDSCAVHFFSELIQRFLRHVVVNVPVFDQYFTSSVVPRAVGAVVVGKLSLLRTFQSSGLDVVLH